MQCVNPYPSTRETAETLTSLHPGPFTFCSHSSDVDTQVQSLWPIVLHFFSKVKRFAWKSLSSCCRCDSLPRYPAQLNVRRLWVSESENAVLKLQTKILLTHGQCRCRACGPLMQYSDALKSQPLPTKFILFQLYSITFCDVTFIFNICGDYLKLHGCTEHGNQTGALAV